MDAYSDFAVDTVESDEDAEVAAYFMVEFGADAPDHECESTDYGVRCDCTCHGKE